MKRMTRTLIAATAVAFVCGLLLLLPGTRRELAWWRAVAGDRADGYAAFLAEWPTGRHTDAAREHEDDRNWEELGRSPSPDATQLYLARHLRGRHAATAAAVLEAQAWQEASRDSSLATLKGFLEKYPKGTHAADAWTRLEDRSWQLAGTNAPTAAGIRAFLTANPAGAHAEEARALLKELEWRELYANGDLPAFKRYLLAQPQGPHAVEAGARGDQLEWQEASASASISVLESYLAGHPDSPHAAAAQARLEDRLWEQAVAASTLPALKTYLARFPRGGRHAAEAGRLQEELVWREARDADSPALLQAYLKTYLSGAHVAEAGTLLEGIAWRQAETGATIQSFQTYLTAYPAGRFAAKTQEQLTALKKDNAPFDKAVADGSPEALQAFLQNYPGHARTAEGITLLNQQKNGVSLAELVRTRKVQVEARGDGITNANLQVQRLEPRTLRVNIPAGTFLISANPAAQNMVVLKGTQVVLDTDAPTELSLPVACANRPRAIPGGKDTFSVESLPPGSALTAVLPLLEKAGANYPTTQAAVWILTDDASYADLGSLVTRSSISGTPSRVIDATDAVQAMKFCLEAGLCLRDRKIWQDRKRLAAEIKNETLKAWLHQFE